VYALGGSDHILFSSILAYVGVDPNREVEWITDEEPGGAMRRFTEGKADAFMGFPPEPQELRAKKIGRVILNTLRDRPWSQYFYCMVAASGDFVSKYPVATKRALRAYLKAADLCVTSPSELPATW
jgi:NitT/TauT family transport system substrate-binding protein